jgi:MoxR-like ATPase
MSSINAKTFKPKFDEARRAISKAIVGNDEAVLFTFVALLCNKPMLLTSHRGRGKTALAKAFHEVIKGATNARLQCTPEMMPGDITGRKIFDEELRKFLVELSKAMTSEVVLMDEINRMLEESQAALMELFEEGEVTIDGTTYSLPELHLWICTRNPDGQAGTFRLADPTRDRLIVDVEMKFPPRDAMNDLLSNTEIHRGRSNLPAVFDKAEIKAMQEHNDWMVNHAPLAVRNYITSLAEYLQVDGPEFQKLVLVAGTPADAVRLGNTLVGVNIAELEVLEDGMSPRAAIWMLHAACALAFIEGEEEVSFEHVRRVFIPSARHKLIMRSVAKSLGVKPEDILNSVLAAVKY